MSLKNKLYIILYYFTPYIFLSYLKFHYALYEPVQMIQPLPPLQRLITSGQPHTPLRYIICGQPLCYYQLLIWAQISTKSLNRMFHRTLIHASYYDDNTEKRKKSLFSPLPVLKMQEVTSKLTVNLLDYM